MARWGKAIKLEKPTGEILTMWVSDERCERVHCVAMDLDISKDSMVRYLSPDAAIILGLALIDIGRKVNKLQIKKK